MMRNTPSARLLGLLIMWIRWAGSGASIRAVARSAGLPAATVAQIEKGQRALKEPKLPALAMALEVDHDDFTQLWELCQGLVRDASGALVSYSWLPGSAGRGTGPFSLATQICGVMERLVPGADFEVRPRRDNDPIPSVVEFVGEGGEPRESKDTPVLWVLWNDPRAPEPVAAVELPNLVNAATKATPARSLISRAALHELIHALDGPERERVRGYVEAVIDQRDRSGGQA